RRPESRFGDRSTFAVLRRSQSEEFCPMQISSLPSAVRPGRGNLRRRPSTSNLPGRPGVGLALEPLEDRCLPSANVISGVVFHDTNNNGLFDAGETPIANNPIKLLNAGGSTVGQTITNASGFYQFASDGTVDVSPRTQSFSLSFPQNKTN